jgi:hypothetical protein
MNRLRFALLLVAFTAMSQASTSNPKKVEMLSRAEELRLIALSGEGFFDDNKLLDGCSSVDELFRGIPQHLIDIMSRMDAFDKKVVQMKNESLELLKETHRLNNRCTNGSDYQFVNSSQAEKHMKDAARMLKRHYGLIEDRPTDYNNSYYYHYDFDY